MAEMESQENEQVVGSDKMDTDAAVDVTPKQDGGVMKRVIREGEGENRPADGDKVFVHYVGTLLDGTKFDSSRDRNEMFDFMLGKGSVIKAWDIGVATMRKGELAVLTCKAEYAYGESGSPPKIGPNETLVFEVELFRWEGEDISEKKDGGVIRHLKRKGDGYAHPNDGATVNVHIIGRYDEKVFEERDVQFVLGEGDDHGICPGLEQSLKKFKQNERSLLKIRSPYAFGSEGHVAFSIPPDAGVTYEVELKSFEKAKETWEMNSEEKLQQAELTKAKGTKYFKDSKYRQAITHYKKTVKLLELESSLEGEEEKQRTSLLLAAHLNLAMCYLKVEDYHEAELQCEKALDMDKHSEKGLFRRGQARVNKNDYELAMQDFKEVLKIDPTNKAARKELGLAAQKLKQFKDREKKLYAGMFTKLAAMEPEEIPTPPTSEKKNISENDSSGMEEESSSEGEGNAGDVESPKNDEAYEAALPDAEVSAGAGGNSA